MGEIIGSEIIAVEFDGTINKSYMPEIGSPNKRLISFLKLWRKGGNKLILWTGRTGKYLDEAVKWCKMQGLEFDAINEDVEEYKYRDSRKIRADYFIDAKNADIDGAIKIKYHF